MRNRRSTLPSCADLHVLHSLKYKNVGLTPISFLIINADLAQNYLMARRYDEAIEQSRRTLALDPRFYCARWFLAESLQMKGQLKEAIAEYEKLIELTDDPRAIAMLAQGYAAGGQTDKARNLLLQIEQLAAHRYVGALSIALVHLHLGETEQALEKIEQACRAPADPDILNLNVEPLLDPCGSNHALSAWSRNSSSIHQTADRK